MLKSVIETTDLYMRRTKDYVLRSIQESGMFSCRKRVYVERRINPYVKVRKVKLSIG